jgi:hypothetical protein
MPDGDPAFAAAINAFLSLATRIDIPDDIYRRIAPQFPMLLARAAGREIPTTHEASMLRVYSFWDYSTEVLARADFPTDLQAVISSAGLALSSDEFNLLIESHLHRLASTVRRLPQFYYQPFKYVDTRKDEDDLSSAEESEQQNQDDIMRRRMKDFDITGPAWQGVWRTVATRTGRFDPENGTFWVWLVVIARNSLTNLIRSEAELGRTSKSTVEAVMRKYRELRANPAAADNFWAQVQQELLPYITRAIEASLKDADSRSGPLPEIGDLSAKAMIKIRSAVDAGAFDLNHRFDEWLEVEVAGVLADFAISSASVTIPGLRPVKRSITVPLDDQDVASCAAPTTAIWELLSGLILRLSSAKSSVQDRFNECRQLIRDYEACKGLDHLWNGTPPQSRLHVPNGYNSRVIKEIINAFRDDLIESVGTYYSPDDALARWWSAVTPRDRAIYVLRDYYKSGEVATIMGLSPPALSTRLTWLTHMQLQDLLDALWRGSKSSKAASAVAISRCIARTLNKSFKEVLTPLRLMRLGANEPLQYDDRAIDSLVHALSTATTHAAITRANGQHLDPLTFGVLLDTAGHHVLSLYIQRDQLPAVIAVGSFTVAAELASWVPDGVHNA